MTSTELNLSTRQSQTMDIVNLKLNDEYGIIMGGKMAWVWPHEEQIYLVMTMVWS